MIDDTRVYEILAEICEDVTHKRSKRGFVSRCPVCGDSNKSKRIKRLHTDWYDKYDDWVVTCYNGGCQFRSGNIYSLYAEVRGVTFTEAKKYIKEDVFDAEAIRKALVGNNKDKKKQVVVKQDPDIDLEWSDVVTPDQEVTDRIQQRYQQALNKFISDRLIPDEYSKDMVAAFQGRYQGRVIVPIYLEGRLRYFQGRSLFPNIEPKYLNPDVDKDMIVSNSDKFDRDMYIIVVEGLIDSWMVEYNQGTSVNGGYVNDILIAHLLKLTDKGIILVPDNPNMDIAGRDTLLTFLKESIYKGKVNYFLMNGCISKDLNDLRIAEPEINIYEHIVSNKKSLFATEMKLKLSRW